MKSSRLITIVMACMLALLFRACIAQDSPQDYLNSHNDARRQVGVPCLIWNDTLAAYAQSYVNNRTGDCALRLSETQDYGENVFVGTGRYTGIDAVNAWVAEKQDYNYASNSCAQGKQCLHYTQVVWNPTMGVGCARAMCNNGSIYISCDYYPAGNVVGQRPY